MNMKKSGFTLIEVMIVLGLTGMLILTISTSLFRSQQRASLESVASQIISDIKAQQTLAMAGVTSQNGSYVDYSIRFEEHAYTLFPGLVYDVSNVENRVIPIDTIISLSSITFPSSVLSFARTSGDMVNYSSTTNSFVIRNSQTGDAHTVTLNKRGGIIISR